MISNYYNIFKSISTPLYITHKFFYSTKEAIKFYIIDKNKEINVEGKKGERLLDICKRNNINIIGACEGGCACSTCHVILDKDLYNKIPLPTEKELDKLDEAPEVTSTSRLSCQVLIDNNFSGKKIKLPTIQKNLDLTLFKNNNKRI